MKLALKVSLLANALLMTAMIIMAMRNLRHSLISVAQGAGGGLTMDSSIQSSPLATAPPAFAGFSWRQIESSDYHKYLANLRAIGCPEQTIRDIIRADVHGLFMEKRRAQGLGEREESGSWSTNEETRVIAALLGSDAAGPITSTIEASSSVTLPLVFRDPDQLFASLDSEQRAALAEIRSEFINRIGGTNQDPTDANYARRWEKERPENDRLLRGMIGVNAFMQFQNQEK